MSAVIRDIRLALRSLRARPGFTITAVLTLALGIGASGAIFSVLDAVLLRPLPYAEPQQLMALYESADDASTGDNRFPASAATFRDWRDGSRSFSGMAAHTGANLLLTGGEPERLSGQRVSGSLLQVLGVSPMLGRPLVPDDDEAGAPPAALISHRLWQRRFGGDPAIIGQSVTLNGESHAVVGVMGPGFRFPNSDADVWVPFRFSEDGWNSRGAHFLNVVARLAPEVTPEAAAAEMLLLTERIRADNPEYQTQFGFMMNSLAEDQVGDVRPTLLLLAGAVALLMLIACANVANLLLARAAGRQREIAVRAALGAGRGVLVRQLAVESLVLAGLAAVAGALAAAWGTSLLVQLAPVDLPRLEDAGLNVRSLVFTVAVALGTGVLFGIAPAVTASRVRLVDTLKDSTRGGSAGRSQTRARSLLLVGEIALSLVLLVGAGLLMRSFVNMRAIDPGFRPEQIMTARLSLSPARYDSAFKRAAFYDEIVERASALPGVRNAAVVNGLPLSGNSPVFGYWVPSRGEQPPSEVDASMATLTSAGYFDALGITLRRGRLLTADDRADAPNAVVINEAMARQHFPNEEPLGMVIRPGNPESEEFTIVGVVNDVRALSLTEDAAPQMYLPYSQLDGALGATMRLVVRTEGDPAAVIPALREMVAEMDRDVPLSDVRPLDGVLADQLARTQFTLLLLSGFAFAAVLLAIIGMYGVIAYSVAQRTREFGIRMALGASRGTVLRQVLSESMRTAAAGLFIGLVVSLLAGRFVASLLYGVAASDPATLAALTLLLSGIAAAASAVPALRATRVAPSNALRAE